MPPSVTPNRSRQQRLSALQRANEIRIKRAQLKHDLKNGQLNTHAAYRYILHPPDWLETMKVFDLISALPAYGDIKSQTLMKRTRVSFAKTLGGLSPRQRNELVSYLK